MRTFSTTGQGRNRPGQVTPSDEGSQIRVSTSYDSWSDNRLVTALIAGDMQALGEVYWRYGRLVGGVLARRLRHWPAADIEDLSQEVLLTLVDRIAGCRNPASLRSFLCGIAVFKAREALRKRSWRERLMALWGDRRRSHDPRAALAAREVLTRALACLPEPQREAVILFEVEGLTVEEVAGSQGVAPNTVWTRLHRARRKLLRAVERDVAAGLGGEP